MHVVIAPDSFKEACSAHAAAYAIATGWRSVRPADSIDLAPMADGGEGTVNAVMSALGLSPCEVGVTGPLGAPVRARYAYDSAQQLAVIEMAAASGLTLLAPEERNPLLTSTRGTGELIAHALAQGARRIIVGLGGSATNDGGAGTAGALGVRLLDAEGMLLPLGGAALPRLTRIDTSQLDTRLSMCEVLLACDVDNPLCGPKGASAVYGPQKGATPAMVAELDAALAHYAHVIERDLGLHVRDIHGTGAAGGLAAGLLAFAGARIQPGVKVVAEAIGLEERIARADLVITGEGRFDAQSAHGKTPAGVAAIARQHEVPVVVLAGSVQTAPGLLEEMGIEQALAISPTGMPLAQALPLTAHFLQEAGAQLAATR